MTFPDWMFVLMPASLALSLVLTGAMRRYALSVRLLDVPNERSSHVQPTPRGGGVAIVLSFLLGLAGLLLTQRVDVRLAASLLGAGALVAVLGFVDDRRHVPARWRFLGHAAATAWVLAWMDPLPPAPILGITLDLGPLALALAALYLVWSINSFNFMDGIDGIASVEAITIAVPGALLAAWMHPQSAWPLGLLFAACVAGFLIWNFPPARIFMGDAGSGFLGLVIGTLGLAFGCVDPALFWSWLILSGCFLVDATTTLYRRWRRGEKVHEAHRSHAYQHASRVLGSHRTVTMAVAVINLAWLVPWATAVATHQLDGLVALILAFAPLLALALHFKAGDRAAQAQVAPGR